MYIVVIDSIPWHKTTYRFSTRVSPDTPCNTAYWNRGEREPEHHKLVIEADIPERRNTVRDPQRAGEIVIGGGEEKVVVGGFEVITWSECK